MRAAANILDIAALGFNQAIIGNALQLLNATLNGAPLLLIQASRTALAGQQQHAPMHACMCGDCRDVVFGCM